MTPLWTLAALADTFGLPCPGPADAPVSGVSIDSRDLRPGDLFFALKGERTDGHAHVAQALASGAAAAVVSRPVPGVDPARLLTVTDPVDALDRLARAARARFKGRVIGLTGSVGKTGTKDMLRTVLETGCGQRVHATEGNLNNHLGVPLTLARLPEEADVAVIEMGMSHAGEIAALTRLARPHIAVITTIGPAHLEAFTGIDAIADAKGEIFEGLEPQGAAILERDGPYYDRLRRRARDHGAVTIIGFGESADADVRLMSHAIEPARSDVLVCAFGTPLAYAVPVAGFPWVANSLAVLAVVRALGLDVIDALRGFAAVTAPDGRGRRHTVHLPGGGAFRIIDESYNANPKSMEAALATLGRLSPGPGGRRIAVLGDMLELGPDEIALHTALVRSVVDHGIDIVYTVGSRMAHLDAALPPPQRGENTADARSMLAVIRRDLKSGDLVMVKGSHGSGVYRLLPGLLALDAGRPEPTPETAEKTPETAEKTPETAEKTPETAEQRPDTARNG